MKRIAVLGAGSWGTTLALHLDRLGHQVRLWEFDAARAEELASTRLSLPFLPDHPLPGRLRVTGQLDEALAEADAALVAVPSHAIVSLGSALRRLPAGGPRLWVSATKGIDEESGLTPRPLLSQSGGLALEAIVVLAGPSFAADVVAGRPTAILASGDDPQRARRVQRLFSSESFRVYTNPDPLGVEIGVSLKNVIAIAAGLAEGLGLGRNALGALVTRGLAEITRLGTALGGRTETFLGLAGIGDLVITATSDLSRNFRVGFALAQGGELEQILKELQMVAEGVRTCRSALRLAARHRIELPICSEVKAVLYDRKDPPRAAVLDLMRRPLRAEFGGENDERGGGEALSLD
jgi:glycerol-3-phosphate dehydrogenase (NAD(P)+)